MSNKLRITIEGSTCSGKSTIISLIKNTLTAQGIDVELDIPDGEDTIPCFGLVNRLLRSLNENGLEITIRELHTTSFFTDE